MGVQKNRTKSDIEGGGVFAVVGQPKLNDLFFLFLGRQFFNLTLIGENFKGCGNFDRKSNFVPVKRIPGNLRSLKTAEVISLSICAF